MAITDCNINDCAGKKLAVIAIGGNSLIKRRDRQSVEDQYHAMCETMVHVAEIIESGWQVVLTHGNGPQVGFIMLRSEIARAATGLHIVPLDNCVADTQGSIGYQVLQALGNELRTRGLPAPLAALVTQTKVDRSDPALCSPDKFVGEFYAKEQLAELTKLHPDWILKEDSGRGWRRVVPSPKPLEIVELQAIKTLLDQGFHVAAVGGGGIPVVESPEGLLGVDAVIDKDLASSLLAKNLGAKVLIISTAVDRVSINYGTPNQVDLGSISLAEAEAYYAQGHFPPGNMGPKINAAIEFLRQGGNKVIITSPENMREAMLGKQGTLICR